MKMRVVLKGLQRTVCRAMSLQGGTSRTVSSFGLLHIELVYLMILRTSVFFDFFKVKAMIEQEVKNGIPSHRIILGGFSQVSTACIKEQDSKLTTFCYMFLFITFPLLYL